MQSTLVAALASLLFSSAAQAAIVIDDFNNAGIAVADAGSSVATEITAGPMIGGERFMQAVWLSGGGDVTVEVDRLGNGTYELTTDAGTTGFSQVIYGGAGLAGLGGVDVTNGGLLDTIRIRVLGIDTDTQVTLQMVDTDSDLATLIKTIPAALSTPAPIGFRFSDMGQGPGIFDFTSVDRISFTIEPQAAESKLQLEALTIRDLVLVPIPAVGGPGLTLLGMLILAAGAASFTPRRGQ